MCGRYALFGPASRVREQFGVTAEFDWADAYNLAPTQSAPVVRTTRAGGREIVAAQWGLWPAWVRESAKSPRPLNAKLETVAERSMFRAAFRRSRVLVPACGFYEWQARPRGKQPYFVRPRDGGLFGFGGLLERRDGPDGVLYTFAILTTAANDAVAPIHDRMPVIIAPEDYAAWLDPGIGDPALLAEIARHYPAARIETFPVGGAVGNPKAQGPELVAPLRSEP